MCQIVKKLYVENIESERLTVMVNGMVLTSSRMKWKERSCCQMFPCEHDEDSSKNPVTI